MKIIIENEQDKVDMVQTMDCVARHLGIKGLGLQNKLNACCQGFSCGEKQKVKVPNSIKKKVTKKVKKKNA